MDTDGEPVCCSSHLLVFISGSEIGSRCFAVSDQAAKGSDDEIRGFSNIEFNLIKASYDPRRGLLLNVPYRLYNTDGGRGIVRSTKVRVDLKDKGSVRIER